MMETKLLTAEDENLKTFYFPVINMIIIKVEFK